MTDNEWRQQTYRLSWLRMRAAEYDDLTGAVAFLKAIGVIPVEEERLYDRTVTVSTSLPKHAIPARYMANFAKEWDSWGPSTPAQFINALSFECAGTHERDAVAEVLAALGAAIQQEAALAA